jgi:ribosomal protein S18 acetylase RimI-like enzyme
VPGNDRTADREDGIGMTTVTRFKSRAPAAPGDGTAGVDRRLRIRPLTRADLPEVARIDAHHTGLEKPRYWRRVFNDLLADGDDVTRIGLAAEAGDGLAGYLIGDVRAFEFGSEPCGWIIAVGIDPRHLRGSVGSTLMRDARARFREAGVSRVRTMVRRNDVRVLSFFRANGFAGGPYVQLEIDLDDEEE